MFKRDAMQNRNSSLAVFGAVEGHYGDAVGAERLQEV